MKKLTLLLFIMLFNKSIFAKTNHSFSDSSNNIKLKFEMVINLSKNVEFANLVKAFQKKKYKKSGYRNLTTEKIESILLNYPATCINNFIYMGGAVISDFVFFSDIVIKNQSSETLIRSYNMFLKTELPKQLQVVEDSGNLYLIFHNTLSTDTSTKRYFNADSLQKRNLSIILNFSSKAPEKLLPILYSDVNLFVNNKKVLTYSKNNFSQKNVFEDKGVVIVLTNNSIVSNDN